MPEIVESETGYPGIFTGVSFPVKRIVEVVSYRTVNKPLAQDFYKANLEHPELMAIE